MDPIKINDEDSIERFVLHQMHEDEMDAFLAYLTLHPEMKSQVEATRERIKTIRASLHPKPTRSFHKWGWWMVILLLVIGSTFFFLYKKPENLTTPIPAEPQTSPQPGFSKEEPIAMAPETIQGSQKGPVKVLAANYRPNEYLEMQLNSALRGDGYAFNVESPIPNALLKIQSGLVSFQLSGTVKQKNAENPGLFQVFIFDNQQANVKAMRYVAAYKLPMIAQENDTNSYELTQKLKLGPGLYYFIIEDDNGSWQFVGRFRVK